MARSLSWGASSPGSPGKRKGLARVDKLVPCNAEEEMKKRSALYEKAKLPFVSYAVVDGNLVTGQNPGSANAANASMLFVPKPE